MKSMLRRFSSVIAIVAISFVLFTATVAVAFDKPPPNNDATAILMANYATPIVNQTILHRDATSCKSVRSLQSDQSLTSKSAEKVYGQVPQVTARSGPNFAVSPTINNLVSRKVAEATNASSVSLQPHVTVPRMEPLEVSRSGSFNC